MEDLNKYIRKSHLRMVEKFNVELEAFRKETDAEEAVLYEDAYTSFTLSNVRVQDGNLLYRYDGVDECETMVFQDEETGEYYEEEYDGISEAIKFWRACFRRAKKYWEMDVDTLDAIQSGEKDDINDDEE